MTKELLSAPICEDLYSKIENMISENIDTVKRPPRLDIIRFGNDEASIRYTQMKKKRAGALGIDARIHIPMVHNTEEAIDFIKSIKVEETDGVMVQLPLPSNLNEAETLNAIDPTVDVDGLTVNALASIWGQVNKGYISATPKAVIKLLDSYEVVLKSKEILVINDSPHIGRQLAGYFLNQEATVVIAHKESKELSRLARSADIVVSATGVAGLIDFELKDQVLVIDIGISKNDEGKLVGDLDLSCLPESGMYTPVKGGIGPLTVASLLENCVISWLNSTSK